MSENIKYILTLTIICFITATLLTGVYLLTRPKILEQKAQEERQALKEVLPAAGYFEPVVRDGQKIYCRITGIKILAQKETPGMGAKIEEVKVQKSLWQAIKELFTKEQRVQEIPDKPWFCAQFKGKKIGELIVVKTPTEKNIQAITGATISSEALTDSVREKAKEILQYEQQQ